MEAQASLELDCETRTVHRLVEVKLSVAEKAALKDKAHEVLTEMKKIKGEFEMVKSEYNTNYKKAETELFATIEKMSESRNEECSEKRFFSENKLEVWFGDELIESRAMSAEELQADMFPTQHGVVMEAEETAPQTEEEIREDISDVITEEKKPNKPSLVDMR